MNDLKEKMRSLLFDTETSLKNAGAMIQTAKGKTVLLATTIGVLSLLSSPPSEVLQSAEHFTGHKLVQTIANPISGTAERLSRWMADISKDVHQNAVQLDRDISQGLHHATEHMAKKTPIRDTPETAGKSFSSINQTENRIDVVIHRFYEMTNRAMEAREIRVQVPPDPKQLHTVFNQEIRKEMIRLIGQSSFSEKEKRQLSEYVRQEKPLDYQSVTIFHRDGRKDTASIDEMNVRHMLLVSITTVEKRMVDGISHQEKQPNFNRSSTPTF